MNWHSPRELLAFILRSGKRIAILVIGLTLVVGGLAMLVLPGPGILVVIAGLAVLATEFVWAERMLDTAKGHATRAKNRASGALRRRRG
jgi:uncharacterized protein (TIGR02611 family)